MKRIASIAFLLVLLGGGFFVADVDTALAQTCECFCESAGGAVKVGDVSADACREQCLSQDVSMVTCAAGPKQYPNRINLKCFSQEQCQSGEGEWADVPAPDCTDGQRYCYPQPSSVSLAISIPEIGGGDGLLTEVPDVGVYINTGYRYAVGLAMTIAVVMLMIGGVQYMTAGGAQSQVGKGKERMLNAVVGLVLLISTAVILQTVNPNLLRLTPPRLPMVRPVVLDTDFESCETLDEQGYDINESNIDKGAHGAKFCGTVAEVTHDPERTQLTGKSCEYRTCPPNLVEKKAACVGSAEDARCLTCEEIMAGTTRNIKPSPSVCRAVNNAYTQQHREMDSDGIHIVSREVCSYTQDGTFLGADQAVAQWIVQQGVGATDAALEAVFGEFGADANEVISRVQAGTCVRASLDCTKIQECEDYEDVPVRGQYLDISADLVKQVAKLEDLEPGIGSGGYTIKSTCQLDPCGVADKLQVAEYGQDSTGVAFCHYQEGVPGAGDASLLRGGCFSLCSDPNTAERRSCKSLGEEAEEFIRNLFN